MGVRYKVNYNFEIGFRYINVGIDWGYYKVDKSWDLGVFCLILGYYIFGWKYRMYDCIFIW